MYTAVHVYYIHRVLRWLCAEAMAGAEPRAPAAPHGVYSAPPVPFRTPFLFPAASSASRSRIFSRGALRRGHGFKVAAKKQRVLNGTQVAAEGVKPNPSWLSNKQTGGGAVQKEKRC